MALPIFYGKCSKFVILSDSREPKDLRTEYLQSSAYPAKIHRLRLRFAQDDRCGRKRKPSGTIRHWVDSLGFKIRFRRGNAP